MKYLTTLAAAVLLSGAPLALADTESVREAEALLANIGLEDELEGMFTQMVDLQLQNDPEMLPLRGVMLEFFAKYFSFESLKPDLVKIYSDAFTAQELTEINAFYSTATGRKTIALMPELMNKGGQIGEARVRENIDELRTMIEAELERIEAEKAASEADSSDPE